MTSDLHAALTQSPGQTVAYLRHAEPEPMAETLTALANAEGGTLVLGCDVAGRLGDVFVEEDAADALRAALRLCRPPVHTDWSQQQVPGGTVVVLRVERSGTLHSLWDGRVLVRKGPENRPVDGAEIEQLLANRPVGDFELQEVAGATREDLDEDIIDNYLERRQKRNPRSGILPKDKLLQQIGAVTEARVPTVSGMLLFGREPQLFLPQSRAIFVRFADVQPRGPEGSFGYGRREELIGPLPVIIDRAWRVMWEEMDKQAVVRGLQRHEETEYPQSAVREALVNAVAHRDYRLTGRSIEIRMYTDRLEVTSPGGLPAHITLDNIVEEHYSRNPRIVNGLYQWGYIEELGLGVDRMIEDMVSAGHMPPKFEAKSHRFSVILYNRRDPVQAMKSWEQNMNERQIKAIEFLQRHGTITNRDYRDLCPHVGPETLRLDLADLVSKGLVLKIGDKRGTRYILK
ncbi:MAG: putative DNA binding domain-containing protein [Caldilineaceae bacterium]|nr:putative DNA binding domain-containing protein [Caldilineaceae bacterium]